MSTPTLSNGFHALVNTTAAGSGQVYAIDAVHKTFTATVKSANAALAVSASVDILVSNDGMNFLTLATFTLSGTGSFTDGFASDADYAFYQARVISITGGDSVAVWVNV